MNAIKVVGRRKAPQTAEEFHALGARLDHEAVLRSSSRPRGCVFKARTWEDLERWEANQLERRIFKVDADE